MVLSRLWHSSSRSVRSASNNRAHLPLLAHRPKRLNTVFQGPNAGGRSRQDAPVRRHPDTASTKRWSLFGGRPHARAVAPCEAAALPRRTAVTPMGRRSCRARGVDPCRTEAAWPFSRRPVLLMGHVFARRSRRRLGFAGLRLPGVGAHLPVASMPSRQEHVRMSEEVVLPTGRRANGEGRPQTRVATGIDDSATPSASKASTTAGRAGASSRGPTPGTSRCRPRCSCRRSSRGTGRPHAVLVAGRRCRPDGGSVRHRKRGPDPPPSPSSTSRSICMNRSAISVPSLVSTGTCQAGLLRSTPIRSPRTSLI